MTESSEKMTALVQLAGTVAHELNNIFMAVTGNLSLLDQERDGSENHDVTVKDIVRAAQRGIDLTSKLQAFAGRQRLHRENLDLNALVSSTMSGLRPSLAATHVNILLAEAKFIVYADKQKLADAIAELIKNAQAALPSTGGRIIVETLQAGAERHCPHVILRIRDNGRGMSPEVMARATEPLFTTCPRGMKMGWGLSYCAGFIRQLGGELRLSSKEYLGTVVEISLPLENAD